MAMSDAPPRKVDVGPPARVPRQASTWPAPNWNRVPLLPARASDRGREPGTEPGANTLSPVLRALPDPVFVLDADGRFTALSDSWTPLTGMTVEEALGKPLPAFVHPDDAAEVRIRLFGLATARTTSLRCTFRFATNNSKTLWLEMHASLHPGHGDGSGVALVGVLRDVSGTREEAERLMRLAMHDPLLDIPNRALVLERLRARMAQAERQPHPPFALALLDIDDFRSVTDIHGHRVGDEVLRSVARQLQSVSRDGDTVARMGGDEFAVLLDRTYGLRDALRAGQRLKDAVKEPLAFGGRPIMLRCSVGVATSGSDPQDVEQLLDRASIALRHAKRVCEGVSLYEDVEPRSGPRFTP